MKPEPIKPNPDQESVWDYPRPPRLELVDHSIQIVFNGVTIADTTSAYRVLETSHPPSYYIPPSDIKMSHLPVADCGSLCEWKGQATYHTVSVGNKRAIRAAWGYYNPTPQFAHIKKYLAFYPGPMDACYVDGELVVPQPGCFYGGWVTSKVTGPFKGEPGSWHW